MVYLSTFPRLVPDEKVGLAVAVSGFVVFFVGAFIIRIGFSVIFITITRIRNPPKEYWYLLRPLY